MTKNLHGFQLQAPAWTNWFGNQSCVPAGIVEASNEQDVETAIVEASRSGLRLRTPGPDIPLRQSAAQTAYCSIPVG